MKYVVFLLDGMADYEIKELGNKTPLEVAYKPNIKSMSKDAYVGLIKSVADGMKPGSDVANLSILGYDPYKCYTGRSPLEAGSIGIDMKDTIAIGDGLNDVEMIKAAAYGIAMGNSSEILKENADYVTDDVSNDGLYKAFKYLELVD